MPASEVQLGGVRIIGVGDCERRRVTSERERDGGIERTGSA